MTAIDSSQLYVDPKAILKINITGDLEENATIFFILEEVKNLFWIFLKEL